MLSYSLFMWNLPKNVWKKYSKVYEIQIQNLLLFITLVKFILKILLLVV